MSTHWSEFGAIFESSESGERTQQVLGFSDTNGLHVIFDFDRTLTSRTSLQCHDCLKLVRAGHEPERFLAEVSRFLDFSDGGHPELKGQPMRMWWDRVHALLAEHRVSRDELLRRATA